MESYCLKFILAFSLLLTGIEGRIVDSSSLESTIGDNNLVDGFGDLINRLDQLEAKVEQHEREINQLKKKNSDLEDKNQQLSLIAGAKNDYATSHASSLPRSCFELKATNPSASSGVYFIDPDGQIGADQPIQVYCDMATKTTSIYHDTEAKTKITGCLDPGCYTKAITYNATLRQLAALADISSSCKQHIRFDSFVVPLEYNNASYGYWNDRNNNKQIFWAGPATTNHTCQCGISKNCIEKIYKCNSDSLAPIELVDEGYITATELLPVTRFSFGRTSLTGVKASYTLGRFECTGQAAIPSKPSNCRDLFKTGHTLNGFYDVDRGNNQISSVYCDFSKSSTETGYETRYGQAAISSKPTNCRDLFKMGHTLSGFYDVINGGNNNQISSVYCDFSKSSTETGYETRYGQAAISSKPTNCQDLFKMGHTLSGFYNVKSGSNQIASTYCDFSKSSTETGYETRVGFVDVKSAPVHFFVTRTSSWSTYGSIPFEKEYLNLGGWMSLASGVFTAPKAGIYAFTFKGNGYKKGSTTWGSYSGYGQVFLQRNGADIARGHSIIYDASFPTESTLSIHSILKLNKWDTIRIRNQDGTLFSYSDGSDIQFTGSLLEEDLAIS